MHHYINAIWRPRSRTSISSFLLFGLVLLWLGIFFGESSVKTVFSPFVLRVMSMRGAYNPSDNPIIDALNGYSDWSMEKMVKDHGNDTIISLMRPHTHDGKSYVISAADELKNYAQFVEDLASEGKRAKKARSQLSNALWKISIGETFFPASTREQIPEDLKKLLQAVDAASRAKQFDFLAEAAIAIRGQAARLELATVGFGWITYIAIVLGALLFLFGLWGTIERWYLRKS